MKWCKTVYVEAEAATAEALMDLIYEVATHLPRVFANIDYVETGGPLERIEHSHG